jgi:hypothetical protein
MLRCGAETCTGGEGRQRYISRAHVAAGGRLRDINHSSCSGALTEPVVHLVGVHGLGRQEAGVVVVGVIQAARVPAYDHRT